MNRLDRIRDVFPKRTQVRRTKRRLFLERLEERSLLSVGGLVAAYSFNEGSGTTVHDLSGNGNNGAISNATWSTAGGSGGALSFNGTNSYVTINDSNSLNLTNSMTLEAWVDPKSATGYEDVLIKETPSSGLNYALYGSNSNSDPAANIVLSSGNQSAANPSGLPLNTWSFLAATYNGSSLALYVNGNLVKTTSVSGGITTSTGALQIGGDSGVGQYFKGLIDEVRIYNQALSQTQIQTDMNTPVANTPPVVTGETPAPGASNVPVSSPIITATFTVPPPAGSVHFSLTTSSGSAVPENVAYGYNGSSYTVRLWADAVLAYGTTYTATVSGAANSSGIPMTAPFTWSFTTDAVQPAVSSHTPASGATGVAVSTPVTATFNKPVSAVGFTLTTASGSVVPSTVSYNSTDTTVTLTPSAKLAYGTTYTATVSGATDSAGDPIARPVTWSFTTYATKPLVSSHTPTSSATNVAVSKTVTATFNEAVQSSTIGFTLTTSSGRAIAGTVSYNGANNTVTLKPSAPLAYGTTYTATVSGAKDTAGDPMAGPVTWSFTTDSMQPAVITHTSPPVPTGMAISSPISVTFNEAVQASTIGFTLTTSSGSAVLAALSYNSTNNTVTLTPSATLTYGTTYTATVSGADDTAGDPMGGPVSFSVATAAVQPAVSSHSPTSGATGVAVSTSLMATFNEAVQSSTISFTLATSAGTSVAGTASYNNSNNTVTLTPNARLAYGTTYYATVSGAKDKAGDPMTGPVTWSFTTDAVPPAVSSHTPTSGATGVAVSTPVTATFNEAVQSSTIGVTLTTSSGSAVAGTATYNSINNTVTLTPSTTLAYGTTYTATVSGAKDTAGDPMSGPVTWSFTTDAVPPAVSSHTPTSGATGVAVSTPVTATFNEAVQSSTIGVTLTTSSGSAVAGTATYNSINNTVTLTPSTTLAYGTTYTATVSGAKDTAGDPMSGPVTWSFTTDAVQPVVSSRTPTSGATGVAVSTPVTATFNEAVQSSTIGVTLTTSSGSAVAGTATYNSTNNTVTLTPSATLAYGTTYTATVSGTKDTAGDAMSGPVTWSFTTATSSASTPYSGSQSPIPGIIQAENFDNGGQGVAYYDTTPGNSGGAYRNTDVDIETCSDTGGGYDVCYVEPGEWLNYTVNVASTGMYQLSLRVASSGQGGTFNVDFGGINQTGTLTIPNTGGWQVWQTITANVHLTAGEQIMQVDWDSNGPSGYVGNLNWLQLTNSSLVVSAGNNFSANAGANDTFAGSVSGGIAPYTCSWSFGDGTTSSGSLTPSHVYANPGTYTAVLTVADSAANSGSSSVSVTVNDVAPTVTFADPVGTVGAPVNFTASATDISPADQAAGFTYSWNFGDGGTATGASTSHAFSSAGTYTVAVTATDEYGKTGTATGTIVIGASSSSLTVSAGNNITASAGATVNFAGAVSGGVAPYTDSWDFGDGNVAIGTLSPTHVYATGGSYTAILTVTDSKNESSSSSILVTVNNVAPAASLVVPSAGTVGAPVGFSASATDPSPVDQVAGFTYNWNFGDGTTGTGVTPVHVYSSPGTYTVSATATDENGKTSAQATGKIVVSAPTAGGLDGRHHLHLAPAARRRTVRPEPGQHDLRP